MFFIVVEFFMARDFLAIFDMNLRQCSQLGSTYLKACGKFFELITEEQTAHWLVEELAEDTVAKIENIKFIIFRLQHQILFSYSLVCMLFFIALVPFKENVGDNKAVELLSPAAEAAVEEMACCKDLGKEADKAAAAAAVTLEELLLRSLVVAFVVTVEVGTAKELFVKDSNCKRGCLKIKLLGFKELLLLLIEAGILFTLELLAKFEKTFVELAELEENVVESLALSSSKSLEVLRPIKYNYIVNNKIS